MVVRPLVWLTMALACGIILEAVQVVPIGFLLAVTLMVALASAACFFLLNKNVFPFLVLFFFLLGSLLANAERFQHDGPVNHFIGQAVILEGQVCREPEERQGKTNYVLEVKRIRLGSKRVENMGRVLLSVSGPRMELVYGDEVRVRGRTYLPDSTNNPGQFQYAQYLRDRGIWAIISVEDQAEVKKIGSPKKLNLFAAALSVKHRLMDVNRKALKPEHAALVNGIVFGSRGEIDDRTMEIFNEAGVVHILSVSGLNVGLLAAGVMGLMTLLGLHRLHFPVVTVVLLIYTFITGMGPAVVRAAIMAWAYLLGRVLGRDQDWPTTLSLAALVILVFSPGSLFEPGFQLSFAATWGILQLGPWINRRLESLGMSKTWLRGSLAIPLSAQIGTLPFILYYYNLFSLISIPANLLAVPLVGLILPLGLVVSLAGLVLIKMAVIIHYTTAALLDLMVFLTRLMHDIPGGLFYLPTPPLVVMVCWYVAWMLLTTKQWDRQKEYSLRILASILLGMIILYTGALAWHQPNELRIHVIDVGQGDSLLVQFPNGRNMLVDTGGWKDEFRKGRGAGEVVAAYLRRMGLSKIDALVLTHPHEDHAGGARHLQGRFEIGAVLVSPTRAQDPREERADPSYFAVIQSFREQGTPVKELFSEDWIRLDPQVQIEILSPSLDLFSGTRSDLNNNSLVLSLRYGRKSFLLTGDIELEAQEALIKRGVKLQHDVLKVPHHGSKFLSPDFVRRVNHEISVISVGNNQFGQPDSGTVALLGTGEKTVHRTDVDGRVLIRCDGNQIKITTAVLENRRW